MKAFATMFDRADALGFTDPEHYLWFKCQWHRNDPTQPLKKWDTAWRALRAKAGLPRLRFHDLRHTFITEMAGTMISNAVLQSITGQLSQRMLEHYTHIGMIAKRRAFDELDADREAEREKQDSESIPEPTDDNVS